VWQGLCVSFAETFPQTGGELEGVIADTFMLDWRCFESTA